MRKANITLAFIAVLFLVGITTLAIKSGVAASRESIKFNTPKLQSTEARLKSINIQYETLNTELNKKTSNDQKTIDSLHKQQEQLKKEREDLQKQLQAKADEKERLRVAAANAVNTLTATASASAAAPIYGGSHEDWMAAAGIDPGDYGYVDYIVSHESGWRVNAYNPSGATGLCQALPASKMASSGGDYLTNPVTQLMWCNGYAQGRYGGWGGAYSFWVANRWW